MLVGTQKYLFWRIICCTYRVKNSVEDPVSEDQGNDPEYEGEGGEEEEKEFLGGEPQAVHNDVGIEQHT